MEFILIDFKNTQPYSDFLNSLDSPRSRSTYARHLKHFQLTLGDKELKDANEDDMNRWVRSLRAKTLKSSYMRTLMASIHSFFKWAIRNKKLKEDPTIVLPKLKGAPPAPKPLNKENRQRLLDILKWDTLEDYQMSMFILVGSTLGLRRFEICKIKWDEIDFATKRITGVGKGNKAFDLHIPPGTMARIKDYQDVVTASKMYGTYFLFTIGKPDSPLPYHKPWIWSQEFKKRLGLDAKTRLTPHVLRHDFATEIMQSGKVTIDQAMKMTRHNDAATIMRYNEVDKEVIATASDEIFG